MRTHFHVGHNIPGYLPEDDVMTFAAVMTFTDWRDAAGALADELRGAVDSDPEFSGVTDEEFERVDEIARHLDWLGYNRAVEFAEFDDARIDVGGPVLVMVDAGRALPVAFWLSTDCAEGCIR